MAATDVRPPQTNHGQPESATRSEQFDDIIKVLRTVSQWSPANRIYLIQKLLEDIAEGLQPFEPQKGGLDQLHALLKSDSPPPDDEEVERILEQARVERWNR